MNRAANFGWFVSFMCAPALALAVVACSTSGNISATSDDSGSTTGAEPTADDASLLADDADNDAETDATLDATLDAAATSVPDSTIDADGTDGDATVNRPPVDAAATCKKPAANDPCGLDPQCGCASQETCDVDAAGTVCVAAGNALAGHGCTTTASCAPGLTCFNGACRPYCTNTGDAGCDEKLPEGGACVAIVGEDGGPLPNYDVCTFRCQLQDPKACGPTGDLNSGCIYDDNGGTDCEGVGISTVGDSCMYLNDCLPGLVCVGECLPWCRVGHTPSDCGDGEACQGFGSPALTANGVEYGYCP